MTRKTVPTLLACVLCVLVVAGAADSAARGRLSGIPEVTRTAGGHQISFTLTAPNDVTVRVLDAKGQVVRHLACGTVGVERAPKPFAPKTLSQKIMWDGNDDQGNDVSVARCRVSIAVGVRARFDKFVLWEPDCFAVLSGGAIAVGPNGRLYVVNHLGVHYATLRLFDGEGKYVRSLWPFDPALPMAPELYKTWGMEDYEGRTVPISVNHSAAYWFVVHSSCLAVNPHGVATGFVTWGGKQHWVIDDTLPVKLKTTKVPWCTHKGCIAQMSMAVGPEGDFYVADPGAQSYKKEPCGFVVARLRGAEFTPVNAFHYSGKRKLAQPRYYLGTLHESGDDDEHFKRPSAVAVMKDGTILVSDDAAIKVFRKDGLLLKRIDTIRTKSGELQAGGYLAANLKSGTVYANLPLQKRRRSRRVILRLDSIEDPVATVESPPLNPYASQIAVDPEANLVWAFQGDGKDTLLRLRDAGDRFESTVIK
ncbi:MAG: hypothetical protein AMK75_05285 [Planctomycetes bacterium SM23_65]|nr:MAG: hypothetical protein AMK75_05285 [Planctomycetes bacterium SM23_65]